MNIEILFMYAVAFLGGIFGPVIYFTPSIIAFVRRIPHPIVKNESVPVPHREYIFLVNLTLGWTVIAWIICIIWVLAQNTNKPQSADEYEFYEWQKNKSVNRSSDE